MPISTNSGSLSLVSQNIITCFCSHVFLFSVFSLSAELVTVTVTVNQCAALSAGLYLNDAKVEDIQDVAHFSSFCKADQIRSVNGIPVESKSQICDILGEVPSSAETVVFSVERGELPLSCGSLGTLIIRACIRDCTVVY